MSQELMIDLQRRIDIANSQRAYAQLLLQNQAKIDYPNFTSKESLQGDINNINAYMAPTTKNIVFNMRPQTEEEEKQSLRFNLQRIMTASDSADVVEMLTSQEVKIANQFFDRYMESIKGVKFTSTTDIKNNIVIFVDKVANRVSVKKDVAPRRIITNPAQAVEVEEAPQNVAELIAPDAPLDAPIDVGTKEELLGRYYDLNQVVAVNRELTGKPEEKREILANILGKIYAEIVLDYLQTEALFKYINKDLDVSEAKLMDISKKARKLKMVGKIVIKDMSATLCRALIKEFATEYQTIRTGSGFGLKMKRLRDLKAMKALNNSKAVKFGKGATSAVLKKDNGKGFQGVIPSEKWKSEKTPQLYVDIGKLHENILCVKYSANNKKKVELAITEPVKIVLLQMMLEKFNYKDFDRLTESEKKVICFFNTIFHLINEQCMPNPIDELYTKFNILRGEINASNDNPLIKQNLKQIAFELHKYKKLNSAQLRNLFFELSA